MIQRLNEAIGYIDRHLDGEIDYGEVSRITLSPIGLFQRFFVLAAGITLTEYIRRRKLTRALADLQKTEEKVIDIAAKYGYESPDAFGVAFKRLYGVTPSQARKADGELKHYGRIFFNLKISYVKGEKDMILLNVDNFRYYGPLFEGARILLTYLGETYSPAYIQGISGAAFKIAGGCPSRPTCVCDYWPAEFLKFLGYEVTEYPCKDEAGNDVYAEMLAAVKKQIDSGKPALVWHAFSNEEWDIVCGYDDDTQQFIGRGAIQGNGQEYARESWDRPKTSTVCGFGAVITGDKIETPDMRAAEIASLQSAVKHARKEPAENADYWLFEGICFYKKWVEIYSHEGADRGLADAYCYDVYSSVRRAAVVYLREIAGHFGGRAMAYIQKAANEFERECEQLTQARPYIAWESPWGVDEARSQKTAPILKAAAGFYEKGIEFLEKALPSLR